MNKFEIIAKWIHSESDEPISEIEWLLKEKYKTEKNLLKDYDDVIKEKKWEWKVTYKTFWKNMDMS